MPHCWKSHALAHIILFKLLSVDLAASDSGLLIHCLLLLQLCVKVLYYVLGYAVALSAFTSFAIILL